MIRYYNIFFLEDNAKKLEKFGIKLKDPSTYIWETFELAKGYVEECLRNSTLGNCLIKNKLNNVYMLYSPKKDYARIELEVLGNRYTVAIIKPTKEIRHSL